MSIATLHNDFLTVDISTTGAEMQSIREADGTERLWNGDPAFWTGRAPILFPVCGGLRDDRWIQNGVSYTMPKHGFARRSEWGLVSADANRAEFLLTKQHPGFPFRYELRAEYVLDGRSITISYKVTNKEEKLPFWFALGSHEAWATPGGLEHYTVVFDQPETLGHHPLTGNVIGHTPVIMGENVTELPLKTEYFAVDALVFPDLKSRAVTLKNDLNDKTVRVEYEGMDVLMLWQKPGAGYFCIEPWCKAPDYEDADYEAEKKPGCMKLMPGETIVKTHKATL